MPRDVVGFAEVCGANDGAMEIRPYGPRDRLDAQRRPGPESSAHRTSTWNRSGRLSPFDQAKPAPARRAQHSLVGWGAMEAPMLPQGAPVHHHRQIAGGCRPGVPNNERWTALTSRDENGRQLGATPLGGTLGRRGPFPSAARDPTDQNPDNRSGEREDPAVGHGW